MFRDGMRVAHIAKELGIGRGSVYRALEAAGITGETPNNNPNAVPAVGESGNPAAHTPSAA